MMIANSDYITINSLGIVQLCGYDSTGSIVYSAHFSIMPYASAVIIEKLNINYEYKIVFFSPVLEFTIGDTTSSESIETTFKFSSDDIDPNIDISFKWNGRIGGFVIS